MFFSILKWVFISLTLIFLIHHLYIFLMNMLTVPKIKDLVNKPNQQYKDILDTLQNTKKKEDNTMTNELSSFLNELKKTNMPEANSMAKENSIDANENSIDANEIGATPIDALNFNNVKYSPY
jgi:hypothetical protein